MKKLFITIVTLLSIYSFTSFAEAAKTEEQLDPNAIPIYYVSNIPNEEFLAKLKEKPIFSNLKEKLYGSPIYFRTTIQNRHTSGGSAGSFFSVVLAGSTLGLLPIVTNKDFILRYEVFVNGEKLFDQQFTYNQTDVKSLYSDPEGNKLNPEILEWAKTTIDKVTQSFEKDPKIKQLIEEYNYYFKQH